MSRGAHGANDPSEERSSERAREAYGASSEIFLEQRSGDEAGLVTADERTLAERRMFSGGNDGQIEA